MDSKIQAVIGTAGRQRALTAEEYEAMWLHFLALIKEPGVWTSGGAAGADSLLFRLILEHPELVVKAIIHLPGKSRDVETMFKYYQKFKPVFDCADALQKIRELPNVEIIQDPIKGFLDRNIDVAKSADFIVAYTFGPGDVPADGGTRHTWFQSIKLRPDAKRVHIPIQSLTGKDPKGGEQMKFNIPDHHLGKMIEITRNWILVNGWLSSIAKSTSQEMHNITSSSNPRISCQNCVHAVRLDNPFESFDRCGHPKVEDVYIEQIGAWDSIWEWEKHTHRLDVSEDHEQTIIWEAHNEAAQVRWVNRDVRDFSIPDPVRELTNAQYERSQINRAMYVVKRFVGKDGKAIYKRMGNEDWCPFHQYNSIALRGDLDEDLVQYHLRQEYKWTGDGRRYHLRPRNGVEYMPCEYMTIRNKREIIYVPKQNLAEYHTMKSIYDPWSHIMREMNYLRDQGMEGGELFRVALVRAKRSMPACVRDRIFYHASPKSRLSDGVFNKAALPDTIAYLQSKGIELQSKKPGDIFAEYRKLKRRERGMVDGQPGSCPSLRYIPDGASETTQGAHLHGLMAVTSKGTLVTPERQEGWKKHYQITIRDTIFSASYWNTKMGIEEKKSLLGCVCPNKGCPLLGDSQEYSFIQTISDDAMLDDAIDTRPNELKEDAEDFLKGLFLVQTETGQKELEVMRKKFGV